MRGPGKSRVDLCLFLSERLRAPEEVRRIRICNGRTMGALDRLLLCRTGDVIGSLLDYCSDRFRIRDVNYVTARCFCQPDLHALRCRRDHLVIRDQCRPT
jgi:hypothetical protein